jgi:hypothetical protein
VSVAAGGRARAAIGWLALAALIGWSACVHHGVGPLRPGVEPPWYAPRASLFAHEATAALLAPPALAFAALGLPALLLAICAAVGTGSALVAALATSCAAATLLFAFYGVVAPFPWEFFGWRGSAAICGVAAAVGFSLAAPLLARSWLALRWPARVLVFAPFALAVLALLRNATGTDASLPFAISPWPAVPVFGLEVAALLVAIWLAGAAAGVAWIARPRAGAAPRAMLAGLALGAGTSLALLAAGSAAGLFPFHASLRPLAPLGAACAVAILVACRVGARDPAALAVRARTLAVGAALVGIPLLAGQVWAWSDYYRTREIRAREIIDALHGYIEREGLYPDELDQLVAAGLLPRIPEPAIGFSWLYDGSFRYESYGTSYLLEFPAPRWVQCHYTPAPLVEDLDPEERAELAADGGLEEAWSCPSTPPELW